MSNDNQTELLPCPFCGGTDIHDLPKFDWVACKDCGASLEDVEPSARELWNRRATPQPSGEMNAEDAVSWQVLHTDGKKWLHVHPVQLANGSLAGRKLRPLFAHPPSDQTRERQEGFDIGSYIDEHTDDGR